MNLKTFCVLFFNAPPTAALPLRCQPRVMSPLGAQIVRIPQVCLHFGWFVVIAQRNLCERRAKVNVVPANNNNTAKQQNENEQQQTRNKQEKTYETKRKHTGDRHGKPFI